MRRSRHLVRSALVGAAMLLAPVAGRGQDGPAPTIIGQPMQATGNPYAAYYLEPAATPPIADAQLIALLRTRVKYVFVLFQENRSFDHYFGSFPGANGLFSDGVKPRAAVDTPGFLQPIVNTDGSAGVQPPFRIGPVEHAADLDDIDHGHARMAMKMHLLNGTGTPQMDLFARVEEAKYTPAGVNAPTLKAKQFGELAMAYVDCDTIPLMWNYAARFTLFDNIFQTTIGPSTPNAIAMISGQAGETQWVKHPDRIGANIPVMADPIPFWGSTLDATTGPQRQPANTVRESSGKDGSNTSQNLTFASLPLTLAGRTLPSVVHSDTSPLTDLADVAQDVPHIGSLGSEPYAWRWYEEGYDHEPNEAADQASHASYIGHHNGAQYFGYVSNNPVMSANMRGLGDFFTDVATDRLPAGGGVTFVRGGYQNIAGLTPAFSPANYPGNAEAAIVAAQFQGDDDHPAYSDSEISEALIAREVNAIARSKYWGESAIVITYDESEGDYDHVPPRILSFDPAGLPLSRGPRIPLVLISPWGRTHATSREEGDHNSVIRLINAVFDLPPLASLPDELQARVAGQAPAFATGGGGFTGGVLTTPGLSQPNLGPHDDLTPGTGNLLSGFDPNRLLGTAPPLPPQYAEIADDVVNTLPHYGGQGCKALGFTTTDVQQGYNSPVPADFNPRPSSFPH